MRVVAGRLKGLALGAVPGRQVRPTTDRVREAWASSVASLCPQGFWGLSVLDAFAGSGALGIEAYSRGASQVLFADNDARALAAVKANLEALGLGQEPGLKALRVDSLAPAAPRRLAAFAPYGLVCLDPPYAVGRARGRLLDGLLSAGLLAEGCLVSYEHRAGQAGRDGAVPPPDGWPPAFEVVSCKRYGDTAIEYLILANGPDDERGRPCP